MRGGYKSACGLTGVAVACFALATRAAPQASRGQERPETKVVTTTQAVRPMPLVGLPPETCREIRRIVDAQLREAIAGKAMGVITIDRERALSATVAGRVYGGVAYRPFGVLVRGQGRGHRVRQVYIRTTNAWALKDGAKVPVNTFIECRDEKCQVVGGPELLAIDEAIGEGEWRKAKVLAERALLVNPGSSELKARAKRISQHLSVGPLLAGAQDAASKKDWLTAARKVHKVLRTDPQNADAHRLFLQVRQETGLTSSDLALVRRKASVLKGRMVFSVDWLDPGVGDDTAKTCVFVVGYGLSRRDFATAVKKREKGIAEMAAKGVVQGEISFVTRGRRWKTLLIGPVKSSLMRHFQFPATVKGFDVTAARLFRKKGRRMAPASNLVEVK